MLLGRGTRRRGRGKCSRRKGWCLALQRGGSRHLQQSRQTKRGQWNWCRVNKRLSDERVQRTCVEFGRSRRHGVCAVSSAFTSNSFLGSSTMQLTLPGILGPSSFPEKIKNTIRNNFLILNFLITNFY